MAAAGLERLRVTVVEVCSVGCWALQAGPASWDMLGPCCCGRGAQHMCTYLTILVYWWRGPQHFVMMCWVRPRCPTTRLVGAEASTM